MILIIEAFI